jgi:hypothetical protein
VNLRKRLAVCLAVPALLFAAGMPALALAATAPPAVTHAVTPAKPGPRGVYSFGPIRNAAHTSWCVTAPAHPIDGSALFMAQCVKNEALQMWHCTRFRGIGECSLSVGDEPLDAGQYGKNDSRVKVINPDKGGRYNYILGYVTLSNDRYILSNEGDGGKFLAMPVKFVKNHVFPLHWFSSGTRGVTFPLRFSAWKENVSGVRPTVTPAKPGPRGVYYTGLLQDVANPAWCLMAVHDPKDNDPVILVQCVRREDVAKGWIATMFRGVGRIGMPIPPDGLVMGQAGKSETVRLVDPDKGGKNYVLYFVKASGSDHYAIRNVSYAGYFLSMPAHPKNGNAYLVEWKPSNTPGYTKAIHIGPWKEDPA